MIFKECFIEVTLNNTLLHFETNLLMDFVKEVSFLKKKKFGNSYKFYFLQKCNEFRNSPLMAPCYFI